MSKRLELSGAMKSKQKASRKNV